MISMPSSLIQVHYHNGLGGVTEVIGQYDRAYRRLINGHSVLFCSKRTESAELAIHHNPSCDYTQFNDLESFNHARRRLGDEMRSILERVDARPAVVVCHNLSLGKNPALSAAMADCAQIYSDTSDIRFFWLLHDLVEEGRMHLFYQINRLRDLGIDADKFLYPRLGVEYVTLNKRDQDLFKACGIHAEMMPNYISPVQRVHPEIAKGVEATIRRNATPVGHGDRRPIFWYPVRMISRKNILEAVILAVLKHAGILVLGGEGNAPEDRACAQKLRGFCETHGLSVVFDIQQVARKAGYNKNDIFPACCQCCDWCITTSVAEGFGYGLYEPWAYKKPVIGRAPQGFMPSGGLSAAHLYQRFDIPADWISLKRLRNEYERHLKPFLFPGTQGRKIILEESIFTSGGMVDFGILDHFEQFNILSRVIGDEKYLNSIISPLTTQMRLFFKDPERIAVNKARIDSFFTDQFDNRFEQCYLKDRRNEKNNTFDLSRLRDYFVNPFTSRLLLVPHC